jgi:DNA-binding NarL/FixJ family response regulator
MVSLTAQPETHPARASDDVQRRSRLLVVDDHPAVRAGLRELLEGESDFELVATVESAEAAMRVAERDAIDVAIVDYQLGSRNGLWLCRKLKRLQTPPAVLLFSAYADGVLAAAAVVAEADGIISKGSLGSELCDEVRLTASGRRSRVAPLPAWLGETVRTLFSDEEQAIFGMLLAGIETDEIARMMGLPASALNSRLGAMLRKLEAPDIREGA